MLTRSPGTPPAARSVVRTFPNACRNCSTMPPGTIFISASRAVWPPRYSVLPASVPCEYPLGAGSVAGLIASGGVVAGMGRLLLARRGRVVFEP